MLYIIKMDIVQLLAWFYLSSESCLIELVPSVLHIEIFSLKKKNKEFRKRFRLLRLITSKVASIFHLNHAIVYNLWKIFSDYIYECKINSYAHLHLRIINIQDTSITKLFFNDANSSATNKRYDVDVSTPCGIFRR